MWSYRGILPATLLRGRRRARSANGFSAADSFGPWHIKADYEIYDNGNKVIATGVFEEWRAARYLWRRSYTGAHFRGTEYSLPQGFSYDGQLALAYDGGMGSADDNVRWSNAPWPEALIADKLLYPIHHPPYTEDDLGSAHLVPPTKDDDSLTCVSPRHSISPMEEYYCSSANDHELRLSVHDFVTTVYTDPVLFKGRIIHKDLAMSINKHLLLKVHVSALDEASIDESIFTTGAPSTIVPPANCGGGVAFVTDQNPYLEKHSEIYPLSARERHIEGTVVVAGIVNQEGYITGLEVPESPDPSLSETTLRYYRRHSGPFEPALINGQPVACHWSHLVNYSLSK